VTENVMSKIDVEVLNDQWKQIFTDAAKQILFSEESKKAVIAAINEKADLPFLNEKQEAVLFEAIYSTVLSGIEEAFFKD